VLLLLSWREIITGIRYARDVMLMRFREGLKVQNS
jgi:hypothetical protein